MPIKMVCKVLLTLPNWDKAAVQLIFQQSVSFNHSKFQTLNRKAGVMNASIFLTLLTTILRVLRAQYPERCEALH